MDLFMKSARYTSTMYSYTPNPKRSSSVTFDEYSSAYALECCCQPQENKAWSPVGRIRRSPRLRDRHLVHPREVIEGPRLSSTHDSKGDAPIHRPRKLLLRSCSEHDQNGEPLRDMIPLGKYQRTGKLIWTTESSAAFKLCQQAISNYQ